MDYKAERTTLRLLYSTGEIAYVRIELTLLISKFGVNLERKCGSRLTSLSCISQPTTPNFVAAIEQGAHQGKTKPVFTSILKFPIRSLFGASYSPYARISIHIE